VGKHPQIDRWRTAIYRIDETHLETTSSFAETDGVRLVVTSAARRRTPDIGIGSFMTITGD
jgi:hypothetical protein